MDPIEALYTLGVVILTVGWFLGTGAHGPYVVLIAAIARLRDKPTYWNGIAIGVAEMLVTVGYLAYALQLHDDLSSEQYYWTVPSMISYVLVGTAVIIGITTTIIMFRTETRKTFRWFEWLAYYPAVINLLVLVPIIFYRLYR